MLAFVIDSPFEEQRLWPDNLVRVVQPRGLVLEILPPMAVFVVLAR